MFKSRKLLTALAACLIGGHLLAQTHVIITAGQSNTDGRVSTKDLPDYIKALSTDKVNYKTGAYKYCKIDQNRNDGLFIPFYPKGRITEGLWAYDAVTYYKLEQALQEDFYVVKYAVGGTSIQYPKNIPPKGKGRYWSANPAFIDSTVSFEKGGHSLLLSFTDAIDASIDRTLSKLKDGYQIDAFLWHQGESDGAHATQYYENLKGVIAYVRKHLTEKTGKDYSKLPFIFGSIPHTNRDYSPVVEFAMKRIAEEDLNAYLVDMSNGELQRDHLHFTASSAEYLGTRMYEILAKIMHLNKEGFSIAKYSGNKQAAISFTFDDGIGEQATLVAPHLDKLGFKGTFFVNGGPIFDSSLNRGTPRVTWAQLKKMASDGHEIASHGWLHKNFGKFSIDEIKMDIEKNDSAIKANVGVAPLTFAYPNNTKRVPGMLEVYKNHIASRLLQISLGSKWTKADLDKRLQNLLKFGGWEVTMTHGINYGYDHFKNPAILWNYFKRVKSLEDKIWVGTFYEVSAYEKERKQVVLDIEPTKGGFSVTPNLDLNKNLYTVPLTAVIQKSGLRKVHAEQDGTPLKVSQKDGSFLFDFNPFGGPIAIKTK